ncbi:ACT domain-containing protein [Anaerolentibacter hominis]|uniref:ACT domain-containing protein n=1 Tax=Anaerolentibacter hominis TaxID=3079009 RepID=UPI0031B89044
MAKQVSVFLENRAGRLEKVTEVLKENGINIVSLSLADSSDYGLVRMIVDKPDDAKAVLKNEGLSVMLTDVVCVRVPHKIGSLSDMLKVLSGDNIEYLYALVTNVSDAAMVLKVTDISEASRMLSQAGYHVMTDTETYLVD